MIKPYIDMEYNDDLNFYGIVFTCGYLPEERAFQICLTLCSLTIAIGVIKGGRDGTR